MVYNLLEANSELEKEMTTHSSILAWRILWMEEPGGLLSVGSHRVGHDWSDLAHMHALEKGMASHSSVLAWRIPGTEEPGGLQSMGSHRVGHDWSDLAAAAAAARVKGCDLGKKDSESHKGSFPPSFKVVVTIWISPMGEKANTNHRSKLSLL